MSLQEIINKITIFHEFSSSSPSPSTPNRLPGTTLTARNRQEILLCSLCLSKLRHKKKRRKEFSDLVLFVKWIITNQNSFFFLLLNISFISPVRSLLVSDIDSVRFFYFCRLFAIFVCLEEAWLEKVALCCFSLNQPSNRHQPSLFDMHSSFLIDK